ncbi:hypothetical protein KXD40_000884 [Peronospora effusa]|nr:hypothetical protein KXD40_000884 [Peronospora effusa]
MSSSSSSRNSKNLLRCFFSRHHHGALTHSTYATGAATQQSQARRIRLFNWWSLSELYVLRELVNLAINKTTIDSDVHVDLRAFQRTVRGKEQTRIGTSSSARSSSSATLTTLPSVSSSRALECQQKRQTLLDSALGCSKRIYFSRRADLRLRLKTRRQFVRLFPFLRRASRAAQCTLFEAFDANNTGKIEFEELCEMLARVKMARCSSVQEMAELVFHWFRRDWSEPVLTRADVKLLAVTVMELGCDSKQQTAQGYDLVASLTKLVLDEGQSQVTKQTFCQGMNCRLGAYVLHMLLAPFDVVKALLNEESILQEVDKVQWKEGDTAFVVSSSWWTKWRRYVQPNHSHDSLLFNEARGSNDNQCEQESGDLPMQEWNSQQQQIPFAKCHPRPGPIANSDISANEQLGTLRRGLAEGQDFVLVSCAVWKRLLQAYGGGPEFPRQVIEVCLPDEQQEMPPREKDAKRNDGTSISEPKGSQQRQQVHVELYPVALQVRLVRHDSRHVYLVYARRFLLHRASTLMEIVHRMGILPGINAREVTLWLRRHRLQAWVRLECSLGAPYASLEGLNITSAQELLVDFRALSIDDDPHCVAHQHRRSSLATTLPRTLFNVAMLQPVGNDFICCPSGSLAKFAQTGDWKLLRESMAAEQEAAATASPVSAHLGSGGVLAGLTKQMKAATRTSRGRLVAHVGLRATGLINMGNTCFMNSALQCFFHSPVFREYFLSNRFESEVNKKNRLGSRGAIAAAYAQLQSAIWRERDQGYLLPGRFRDEFTRVCSHFEETRQYDAHEFMVALLDCLHEDLNQGYRTIAASTDDIIQETSSKCLGFGSFIGEDNQESHDEISQSHLETAGMPSDEVQGDAAWHDYNSVNSSIVVDLFHGQMRSETVCGTCGERKCTFDPNLFFSLPIPESSFVRVEVSVLLQAQKLPGDDKGNDDNESGTALQTKQRGYWLRRGSTVGALCDRIATAHVRASGNRFLLVEVCRNRIKRIVEQDELVDKLATVAPESLAAYERAWTLADIPVVPATIAEYFNACTTDVADSKEKERADERTRSFFDLRVGSRVDVKDNYNSWRSGTVIEVAGSSDSGKNNVRGKHHQRVCVHFDAFSSKWDKWFNPYDWRSRRLQPLHAQTSKSTEVFEVQVVHRFVSRPSLSEAGQTSGRHHSFTEELSTHEQPSLNVFGTPLFVTIASDKTAQDMHQALFLQTARFWRSFDIDRKRAGNNQDNGVEQPTLPYEVRVVNLEKLTSDRGELLPIDHSALLQHVSTRSVLALDWIDCHEYTSRGVRVPDDAPEGVIEAAKMDPDLRDDGNTIPEREMENVQGTEPATDDDSPPRYAVPLTKCMDALMCEEAILLDDHWVCEQCGVPREGKRLSAIWRLPDLVMVQLKRFQYLENQHKQKVRALVDFPLKGLDFSKWMGYQDEADSSLYDLYAVVNHVGGLTRGHYTASCRYDADFPESSALFNESEEHGDVQCSDLWFCFDDEKVSEIAAGDVVTDAAYVLFYKRRKLSVHNVLRHAL